MSNSTQSTSSVPAWQKEFNERIAGFASAIKVDEDKVREIFASLGADGSDENSLVILDNEEFLPVGDLFHAFCDSGLTQKSRVRLGIPHLRGKTWKGDTAESVEVPTNDRLADAINRLTDSNRSKGDWSNEELLDRYDEDEPEIAEVLRKRTHGRPCIVLNRDGSVNKPISLELIKIAKKRPTSDKYVRGAIAYSVYRAGDFPAKPVDESPFAMGVALVGDFCPETDTEWTNVSHAARVLARLYVFDIESAKLSKRDMKAVCVDAQKGVEHFRKEYPKAALRYDELEELDRLPKLKVSSNVDRDPRMTRKDSGFC